MNSPEPNDRISDALAAWRVVPPSNPNFRPAVWARIQRATADSWAGYVRRRALGWSIAAGVAVVVASWSGHTFAQAKIEAGRERMVVSYLGNLDPRVLAKLRPE